jgi:ABC-type glutathione transport system ATPase component
MQSFDLKINREVEIQNSARVQQVASMFELPISLTSHAQWHVNFKLPERWHVSLIVGSSGSGKTTIANTLFSDQVLTEFDWDAQKCVVDCFPAGMPIKDIIASMTSVGFSSPPCWLKPYHVLSNGEKFRIDMARALAETKDLLVVDEFTSVVDRQVAKIAANSVQKIVRNNNKQFVAVSCHFDIIDWLQPD